MENDEPIEEWLKEQISYDADLPNEYIMTPVTFTYPRIVKCYNEIKRFANKSKILKVVYEEWWNQPIDPIELYVYISIYLKINRSLNKKLNDIFEDDFDPDSGDRIQEVNPRWVRSEKNKRYWYFGRKSRPLCGENYRMVLETNDYSNCKCPKEFVENVCRPINDIVRKNALHL
jgi:hypothetical protein